MSNFHGLTTSKSGAGLETAPNIMSYGDVLRISSGAYEFGFGATAQSHCIAIWPMTQPIGSDTLVSNLEMPELSAGVYALDVALLSSGAFFNAVEFGGTLGGLPGLAIFKDDGINEVLRFESTLFTAEDSWYLVGVCTLATPGSIGTVDNLVDFAVVYLQGVQINVISAAALVGIDSDMLDRALALAGHNIRLHSTTFIDGRPATRTLTGADKTLEAIGTPLLEDPTSVVGAGTLVNQKLTLTPSSDRLPDTDISQDV